MQTALHGRSEQASRQECVHCPQSSQGWAPRSRPGKFSAAVTSANAALLGKDCWRSSRGTPRWSSRGCRRNQTFASATHASQATGRRAVMARRRGERNEDEVCLQVTGCEAPEPSFQVALTQRTIVCTVVFVFGPRPSSPSCRRAHLARNTRGLARNLSDVSCARLFHEAQCGSAPMKAPSPADSVRAWVLRYLSSSSALARPRLLVEEYTWPEKKQELWGETNKISPMLNCLLRLEAEAHCGAAPIFVCLGGLVRATTLLQNSVHAVAVIHFRRAASMSRASQRLKAA